MVAAYTFWTVQPTSSGIPSLQFPSGNHDAGLLAVDRGERTAQSFLSATQMKVLFKNAVSREESSSGRFAQVAGMSLVYDPAGTPQEIGDDDTVTTEGLRIGDCRTEGPDWTSDS